MNVPQLHYNCNGNPFFISKENSMLYADLHTHSIASGHSAPETIQAMAREASKKGLYLLGISDHGPATPGAAKASYFRSLKSAPHIRESVHLYYGTEASILSFQGALDLEDNILSALDYAIASIHRPFLAPGNVFQNTDAYLSAMEHPQVRIIGHCDDARYETDYERLICAAREKQILLEINNTSFSPMQYRGNTRDNLRKILFICRRLDYPVILSSDSHRLCDIGNVSMASAFLKAEGFPDSLVINYDKAALQRWLSHSL